MKRCYLCAMVMLLCILASSGFTLAQATVSGYAWHDINDDGIWEPENGERGIPGVTVKLSKGNNKYSTTTDQQGYYSFTVQDVPGNYKIEFTSGIYDNYSSVKNNHNKGDERDSDVKGTGEENLSLAVNQNLTYFNAGMFRMSGYGSITGSVWEDENNDGIKNESENKGVSQVTVTAYFCSGGEIAGSDVTNGSGAYSIPNLPTELEYRVVFGPKANYTLSPKGTDSDPNASTGEVACATLPAEGLGYDAGMHAQASGGNPNGQIRGIVWLDADKDGTQGNVNEPGLNDWIVNLYRIVNGEKENTYFKTTMTKTSNADGQAGRYEFTQLTTGDYCVEFVLKSSYSFTSRYAPPSDQKDSDVNPATGFTDTITIGDNAKEEHIDAGVYELPGTISGHVWDDIDKDGNREADEPKMIDKNVTLKMPNHAEIVKKTDSKGYYIFENVPAGNGYIIQFTLEQDYLYTEKDKNGVAEEFDSDAKTSNGQTDEFDIAAGQNRTFVDAGMYSQTPPASNGKISGKLWDDSYLQNGLQENSNDEPGIDGCTVELYAYPLVQGVSALQSMITGAGGGAKGSYKFEGLAAGDYIVKFSKPANTSDYRYEFTSKDAPAGSNSNDGSDSDAGIDGFTGQITLAESGNKNDVDAGVFKVPTKGTIRITAWQDDGDGMMGTDENKVDGVSFVITNCDGSPVNIPGTTESGGTKDITGLNPGSYKVTFSLKSGFDHFSPTGEGKDNQAGEGGLTTCLQLIAGRTLNFNAGMVLPEAPPLQTGTVTGFVWLDVNGNGTENGHEPGVDNVTVKLFKLNTTSNNYDYQTSILTSNGGHYVFTGLSAGFYKVLFEAPANYKFTKYLPSDVRGQGQSDADNDTDPNKYGWTVAFEVDPSRPNLDRADYVDAGLIPSSGAGGSIGDFVWLDANGDGKQNNLELGVADVPVELYWFNGTDYVSLDQTTTSSSGNYLFSDLIAGKYKVRFSPSSVYTFTKHVGTLQDPDNSDVDPLASGSLRGYTDEITLGSSAPNKNITYVDAGLIPSHGRSIGDLVWYDCNNNGIQDFGEPGVHGVTVLLYSTDNLTAPKAQDITDLHGKYLFSNLDPGTYRIRFVLPNNFDAFTTMDAGGNDALDSDADPIHNGFTGPVTLLSLADRLDIDAGLTRKPVEKANIGDFVWKDCDQDGIQDHNDPGIPNVMVELYKWDEDTPIMSAITNAKGFYLFKDLEPGDYYVKFVLPEGFTFTKKDQGSDDALDSDADRQSGKTDRITLSGHDNLTIDAGLYGSDCMPVSLGDFVWNDLNKNGIQNSGEPGLAKITVNLFKAGKTTVHKTTFTDKNGFYHFAGLLPGTYSVQFILPKGYSFTLLNQGSDDALDSDADMSTGMTAPYNLASGEANYTIDAGMFEGQCMLANLGDLVWNDCNKNGIQDVGESGIGGVEVKLHVCTSSHTNPDDPCTCGSVVSATKTDKNGKYMFANIMPGYYCVEIVGPCNFTITKPGQAEDFKDSDVIPSMKHTGCIKLNPGETNMTVDAGLYPTPPATIGNFVWIDANKNGIQDNGEKGLCNVTVELYMCGVSKPVDAAKTDNDGNYIFKNVISNTSYSLKFYPPKGYTFTLLDQGGNDNYDSDVCAKTCGGMTKFYDIMPDETNLTIDCGMYLATTSACNYVWKDNNNDGVKDDNEAGIQDVTVELYQCVNNTLVQSVKTDAAGLFTFSDILLDTYYLKILVPEGYKMGQASQNGTSESVKAGFGTDGQSSCFDVTDGATSIGKPVALVLSTTGIARGSEIPTEFSLQQNYPNPFNPSTTIEFAVPTAGQYTIKVFNMLGQEVATLLNRELPVGYHMVVFDASGLTSGMYIYRLSGSDIVITKKMMLSK